MYFTCINPLIDNYDIIFLCNMCKVELIQPTISINIEDKKKLHSERQP